MAERFPDNRNLSTLPVELKLKLGFVGEPDSGWLINDELVNVGGVKHYEWLPARARVSKEGTRYEIGTRKQDLDGLLALGRVLSSDVQSLDTIINFWKGHKKFSVSEDKDWLFIGTDIEPLPVAFEEEFTPVSLAYDLALTAALKNMTYEQLAADEWHRGSLRSAESSGGGRALLFSTLSEELTSAVPEVRADTEPPILTNSLVDYPLANNRLGLHFAPTNVRFEDKEFGVPELGIFLSHNKDDQMYVGMGGFDSANDESHGYLRVNLPIPEDVELHTLGDMVKLKAFEVKREANGKSSAQQNYMGEVVVNDNRVIVKSEDGSFELTMAKPVCDGCSIPVWKFPWPDDYQPPWERKPDQNFRMHSVNTSLGIYRCQINNAQGEQNIYCCDCVKKVEDEYAQAHPFVLRGRAIDITRARLDNMGYDDVEIWEDQVWRTEFMRGTKGWEFFTKIEYYRDGRKIIRYTGIPTLSDEGEFTPNMFPREYVTFKYQ